MFLKTDQHPVGLDPLHDRVNAQEQRAMGGDGEGAACGEMGIYEKNRRSEVIFSVIFKLGRNQKFF